MARAVFTIDKVGLGGLGDLSRVNPSSQQFKGEIINERDANMALSGQSGLSREQEATADKILTGSELEGVGLADDFDMDM